MISLLVSLVIAGFILWLVLQIPMPEPFRRILTGVACLLLVLWLLQSFGLWSGPHMMRLR